MHGHVIPALAYRFDTADGSVVFSGDTTVNDDLIALAQGADILVHQVADLGYLERHGVTGAALRTDGRAAHRRHRGRRRRRARRVRELILSHYLPAEPDAITERNGPSAPGRGFSRDHHRGPGWPAQNPPTHYPVITLILPDI